MLFRSKQIENLPVTIQFTNLPKAKFGTAPMSETIYVEVEADGYDLLNYEMKNVKINFNKLKRARHQNAYYFLPGAFMNTISRQLGENFLLHKSLTDTVRLIPSLH